MSETLTILERLRRERMMYKQMLQTLNSVDEVCRPCWELRVLPCCPWVSPPTHRRFCCPPLWKSPSGPPCTPHRGSPVGAEVPRRQQQA